MMTVLWGARVSRPVVWPRRGVPVPIVFPCAARAPLDGAGDLRDFDLSSPRRYTDRLLAQAEVADHSGSVMPCAPSARARVSNVSRPPGRRSCFFIRARELFGPWAVLRRAENPLAFIQSRCLRTACRDASDHLAAIQRRVSGNHAASDFGNPCTVPESPWTDRRNRAAFVRLLGRSRLRLWRERVNAGSRTSRRAPGF